MIRITIEGNRAYCEEHRMYAEEMKIRQGEIKPPSRRYFFEIEISEEAFDELWFRIGMPICRSGSIDGRRLREMLIEWWYEEVEENRSKDPEFEADGFESKKMDHFEKCAYAEMLEELCKQAEKRESPVVWSEVPDE